MGVSPELKLLLLMITESIKRGITYVSFFILIPEFGHGPSRNVVSYPEHVRVGEAGSHYTLL